MSAETLTLQIDIVSRFTHHDTTFHKNTQTFYMIVTYNVCTHFKRSSLLKTLYVTKGQLVVAVNQSRKVAL